MRIIMVIVASTAISYELSANGPVSLKIYDILGREIATLVNERETACTYSVRFDGSRLASGVYFCRLKAGGIGVKKVVLLK